MFGNITIEWDAHFNPDGTRRKNGPPPSQMHGWLAKWRGTFSGNEHLRNEGLREIAKAKARKKMLKERKRKNQGGLFTRWFGNPPSKPSRKSSTHKPARRPSGASGQRHNSQRRIQAPPPPPQRRPSQAAPPQRRPSQAGTPQRRPSQASHTPQRRASQPTPVRQGSVTRPRATPRRSNTTPTGHTPVARPGQRSGHRPSQSRRPTR